MNRNYECVHNHSRRQTYRLDERYPRPSTLNIRISTTRESPGSFCRRFVMLMSYLQCVCATL